MCYRVLRHALSLLPAIACHRNVRQLLLRKEHETSDIAGVPIYKNRGDRAGKGSLSVLLPLPIPHSSYTHSIFDSSGNSVS
ncbi:hypothetical protein ACU8KH_00685 [Lachancea thermotolerans]